VHRWSVDTLAQISIPDAILGSSVVAYSPDGLTVAHLDQSNHIHVLDRHHKKPPLLLQLPDVGFEFLAFSPDQNHLAAGGKVDDKVHLSIWNYQTGELIHRREWEKGKDAHTGIEDIEFSPNGRTLAAVSFRQNGVHLFDVITGKRIAWKKHRSVYGLSFTPDGKTLITAGWDKMVRFWDSGTGQMQREFEVVSDEDEIGAADNRIYTVSADPTGRIFATAHIGNMVRFYHSDNLASHTAIRINGSFVFGSTTFTPDGLWFVSATSSSVQVWDPWTVTTPAQPMYEFDAHEDHVFTAKFGADNRTMVTGGGNIAYLWDLRPQINAAPLAEHLDALVNIDGPAAYQAWWALVDGGDDSVALIRGELARVSKVIDIGRMASGSKIRERNRRANLLTTMSRKRPDSISLAAAKRIISVVSHINTDSSNGLLQQWAANGDEIGKLAAAELKRKEGYVPEK
ncbi:MAG: hypothetical protein HKN47_05990, partial [Pirellulaceae bacterium]|nr:hypothetical protein [Pirellulaceae bacterium]